MSKLVKKNSRVSVVSRVYMIACGLLLSVALAGCVDPAPQKGVPDRDVGARTGDRDNGPVTTAEARPDAGRDADAAATAEPRQSPPASGSQVSAASGEPLVSSGATVQDTAPAAGPPTATATTPVRSAAPPEKPAIDDDPGRLMGLSTAELTRVLGNPRFVRRDATAQLWRYRNKSCILDLFLYRDAGRPEYFVSHIEARRSEGGAAPKRECFGTLLLEQLDREAG